MNAVTNPTVLEFARDELAGKLLKLCIGQLETLKAPWNMTSEKTQEVAINAMAEAIKGGVREAVDVIVTGCKPAVRGKLKTVTFDEGVKAVINIGGGTLGRHDLADAAGGEVLIVLAPYDEYSGGTQKVKAAADQTSLPLVQGEAGESEAATLECYEVKDMGEGMFAVRKDGMPIPDAPLTFETHEAAEDWLQQHLKIGKYAPKPDDSAGADE